MPDRRTRFKWWPIALTAVVAVCALYSAVKPSDRLPAAAVEAFTNGDDFAVLRIDWDGYEASFLATLEELDAAIADGEQPSEVPSLDYDSIPVIAERRLTDRGLITRVLAAIKRDLWQGSRYRPRCFRPRHTVRVEHDGHEHELLICFECKRMLWRIDGETKESFAIAGTAERVLARFVETTAVPSG